MKKPKLEPLPAKSDEMMAYLATMTPVVIVKGEARIVTTLAKMGEVK